MKLEIFLNKWYDKNIQDDGGYPSKEYLEFQSNYRSVLKDLGKEIDFNLHSFSKNHYEFSAVMQSNKTNKFYYISIPDVRYFKNEWANDILYRTMEHDKDWTGGSNNFSALKNLSNNLSNLDYQISRNLDQKINSQVVSQVEPEKTILDDFDSEYDY